MSPRSIAFAFACLATTGVSAADELLPGDGHSIRVPGYDGVVYYTVEQDGYNVVATLASGAEGTPVRLSSVLRPGQRIIISVPQALDRPSVDVEIVRDGDALFISDPTAGPIPDPDIDALPTTAAISK